MRSSARSAPVTAGFFAPERIEFGAVLHLSDVVQTADGGRRRRGRLGQPVQARRPALARSGRGRPHCPARHRVRELRQRPRAARARLLQPGPARRTHRMSGRSDITRWNRAGLRAIPIRRRQRGDLPRGAAGPARRPVPALAGDPAHQHRGRAVPPAALGRSPTGAGRSRGRSRAPAMCSASTSTHSPTSRTWPPRPSGRACAAWLALVDYHPAPPGVGVHQPGAGRQARRVRHWCRRASRCRRRLPVRRSRSRPWRSSRSTVPSTSSGRGLRSQPRDPDRQHARA